MSVRFSSAKAGLLVLPLMLAACGGGNEANNLADLDAKLTNSSDDPVLRGALEDPIAVDPTLAGRSNARAVRGAEQPVNGAVPVTPGDAAAASAAALKIVGGKLLSTPAATAAPACAKCDAQAPVTLGAVARAGSQRGKGGCDAKLEYGMGWAQRLPEPFGLYPGAQLQEAAGAEGASCAIRAASFIAPVKMQSVLDFYYTQAKRAGFDADHQILDGEHVLGGTRQSDDGAYFITFADAPNGGTSVDIVANNGR